MAVNGQTKKGAAKAPEPEAPRGVGYYIREASRDYARVLQADFAELGVTLPQFFYLRILWGDDGVSQTTLSRRIGVDRATASFVLTTMEREKMVERRSDPADARKTNIFLLARGKRLKTSLLRVANAMNERATRGMSTADVARLTASLQTVVENLREPAD